MPTVQKIHFGLNLRENGLAKLPVLPAERIFTMEALVVMNV